MSKRKTKRDKVSWDDVRQTPPSATSPEDLMQQDPLATMSALEINTVRELKKHYIAHMTRLRGGGKFTLGDRYKPLQTWQKAAQLCIRLGASPELFINAQFASKANRTAVYPTALGGKWAEDNYNNFVTFNRIGDIVKTPREAEEARAAVVDDVSSHVVDQHIEQLRMLLVGKRKPALLNSADAKEILTAFVYPFDAWFRVCLFPDDPIIFGEYGARAAEELSFSGPLRKACETKGWPVRAIIDKAASCSNPGTFAP